MGVIKNDFKINQKYSRLFRKVLYNLKKELHYSRIQYLDSWVHTRVKRSDE